MPTTPVTFLREAYAELKKVTWPTRQEVIRLTFLVMAISIAVGLFVGGLDFIFTSIVTFVINR